MQSLHIRLLGEFRLAYGDQLVRTVNMARLQSLLAYLLLHHQAPQSRQHVAFQFWPDSSEKQAHTNLRKLLFQLRNALPDADRFLFQDHLTVQWRPNAPFSLDVTELQALLVRCQATKSDRTEGSRYADLVRVAQLYQGELLPSCHDEWILAVRQGLHRDVMQALEQLINLTEHQREYQAGIRYVQRLLELDPLYEVAYRRLMQLHALNGERAAALHDYHTCVTMLQRELDVEPDEETHALYQQILNAEAQPPPTSPTRREVTLVGRNDEWYRLLAVWRKAHRGQAHFISLAGEAGMGKTRLVEELSAWTRAQGIATAYTRSYEAEGGLAYAPVTEWLRAKPLYAALPKLDKVWLSEVARLLPELLTAWPDLLPPGPLTEAWQRQRFFEALARAVLADPGPALLIIDDLQWCDPETLSWLRYLLRYGAQARLLIIGAWRSEAVNEGHPLRVLLRDLNNDNQLTPIELASLTLAETTALVQQFADQPLSTPEIQQLYQVTEGHPLFVVEMVRANLGDAQTVTGQQNNPLPTMRPALPPKIQTVLASRLAQLSAPARELAGVAATIGRRFTFPILLQAAQLDEDTLVRALDELWQSRIIREQGTDAYDFSHDKMREVAYAELSQVRRRLLHRRVAAALEIVDAVRLDESSGQLAAQYEQAGILDKAAHYWRRAAERAIAQFAQFDALHHLERALALVPPEDRQQRFDLLLAAVKVYNHQGLRAKGKHTLETLQALASMLDDGTAAALRRRTEVALSTADFSRGIGDDSTQRAAAQEAVALAELCGADDLAALAYFHWAMADFGSDEFFLPIRPRLEKVLRLVRAAGLRQTEAEVLSNLALHGLESGRPRPEIEAELQQSLAIYQQIGDAAGEAGALGMLAYTIYVQREGNYDLGIRYCERALQLADGWDAERFALGNLGFLWYYQGDYARARPYLERQLTITQQVQSWGPESGALSELGCLYLAQGNYGHATTYLARALQLCRENGSQRQYKVKVLGLLALLYHEKGEHRQASAYSEEAVGLAHNLGDPRVEGDAFTRGGRVLVRGGEFDRAAELFQQALIYFRQMEQVNHALMPLAGLAEIALRSGELAQARSWVEQILMHLQTHQLDCTDEELYVYMTGYRVLMAAQDARAAYLLQLAHQQLQRRAATLADDNERRMFWSAPPHAEVLAET